MLIPFNSLFLDRKISGIIHIGAHELEELSAYKNKNIQKIIWIEANPSKYNFIEKKIDSYKEMSLGKFAAGSKRDRLFLNVSNNGQSSSILKLGTHKTSYPNIFYTSKQLVDVIPFDSWANDNKIEKRFYNFINIDIQGYELEALKGMKEQLIFADYLYLEVNFCQVYKNCSQIDDLDKYLNNFDFKRVGTYKTTKGWGDAIYVKKWIFLNKIYYLILIPLIRLVMLPLKIFKRFVIFIKTFYRQF